VKAPPTLKGMGRFALSLARAWRFVWRAAPGLTAASVALTTVQSALPLVALYLLKLIVDAITAAAKGGTGAPSLNAIFVLIATAAVIALAGVAMNSIATVVGEAHAQLVADHMHDVLHAKSIEVDLEYYENPEYYDTLHRAQQEAPYRPARIAKGLITVCQSGLSLAAMAALLLSFHSIIALALFIAVVPEALVQLKYANAMYAWRRERTVTERYAQYYDSKMTGSAHAQELRLFDLGGLFMRQFRDLRERLRRERFAIVTRRSAVEFGTQSGATLAVFGAYAFIADRAVEGAITLGALVMYFAAFQRGQEFLRQLLRGLAGLYEDNLFLTNLYEFLDLKRKVAEPAQPSAVPRPLRQGIVFEHVSFHYGTKQALKDVDLVIPAGATVALVGENGSGKTTLIKLLARLYDPSAGRITLDGIDLRDFATAALRRDISVIFQDYVRYNLTARENIWFGNVDCAPDASRITAAANRAGVGDLIRGLPNGFETVLGKWFDDGEELSVGEWQKVALARALLREAQIIVLDEPTSAMDAKAEYEVFKKFREVAAGRTTILISHRLSTVKMADRIYVLRAGRVVECGTHSELVGKSGAYADLFTAQASGYR
jgi:ATP-binding cassette, subfamily B, bacterial